MADEKPAAGGEISDLLTETRTIEPSEDFRRLAYVRDPAIRERSWEDPVAFWNRAAHGLHWFEPWQNTLEWNPPNAKWFTGGKINASYNCCDRHIRGSGQLDQWMEQQEFEFRVALFCTGCANPSEMMHKEGIWKDFEG